MKIDLTQIDREQFDLKEGVFCGLPATLVTPALQGTQWTQRNKWLRSSIWSRDGELLSGGFPRFVNAGENPEHFPMPKSLDDAVCVEKMDGSCAVFDHVNSQFNCRTRGTMSYLTLDNAADFAHCMVKYPLIEDWCHRNTDMSLLCEITSPNCRIVLDYGPEPDLTLIGAADKEDYMLEPQWSVDAIAREIGLKRPRYFAFRSLDHCLTDVAAWEGLEGCVIYSGDGQVLHKIKSISYLRRHRFKETVSLNNLLDLFFIYERPTCDAFLARLEREFDYESMTMARELVTQITRAHDAVQVAIKDTQEIVDWKLFTGVPVDAWGNRKDSRRDYALAIQAKIEPLYQPVAFRYLDNRDIDDKMLRRLMEHTFNE